MKEIDWQGILCALDAANPSCPISPLGHNGTLDLFIDTR